MKSRKGYWVVKQKTAGDRYQRGLKRVADWCQCHRHEPVREQWVALRRKLLGHYGYFGITGNSRALYNFRYRVICAWRKWLSRRSQRAYISWDRMGSLLGHYPLPQSRLRSVSVT
jgi:RNA-directed DNA polymerase